MGGIGAGDRDGISERGSEGEEEERVRANSIMPKTTVTPTTAAATTQRSNTLLATISSFQKEA